MEFIILFNPSPVQLYFDYEVYHELPQIRNNL
jgi:hypothetical protein